MDQSFVGRVYPPTAPYEVTHVKIREFADAIGDPAPEYRDPRAAAEAGQPEVVAPPTFAVIVAFQGLDQIINDAALGLDYSRVVHGDQRFSYTRPIRAGDRLTATATVESIRSLAGNDILGLRCDIATESGEPVCRSWTTLVSRGQG